MSVLTDWLGSCRAEVDGQLAALFPDAWPDGFGQALHYPLSTGGKRIRPALCHAAAHAVLGHTDFAVARSPALAVELVHTYSLVHDDLPAMDDDAERRGMPTVHIRYDEPTAILVGDALLTEAFSVATRELSPTVAVEIVRELARTAGYPGMIGGQVADIQGGVTTVDALSRLHLGKTGALMAFACRAGGLAAAAHGQQDVASALADARETTDALREYGLLVGLAFQLADDVLDADEDAGEDGPPSYCKLLGVEQTRIRSRELAEQACALVGSLPDPSLLEALAWFSVERDH